MALRIIISFIAAVIKHPQAEKEQQPCDDKKADCQLKGEFEHKIVQKNGFPADICKLPTVRAEQSPKTKGTRRPDAFWTKELKPV